MDILGHAKQLGAVINSRSLCLPASSVAAFIQAAMNAGLDVTYVECLYFYEAEGSEPAGTEPSMELSRDANEFADNEALLADIRLIADEAAKRANQRAARAFFQIGLDPDPDLAGHGIKIRR